MPENVYKCPFSHHECRSCPIYRGKHSYVVSKKGEEPPNSRILKDTASDWQKSFKETLGRPEDTGLDTRRTLLLDPQGTVLDQHGREIRIVLKVLDKETGDTRNCTITEASTWDWENRQKVRSIGVWHIHSFEKLLVALAHKAEAGCEEVELIEAPFYMGC